MQGAEPNAGPRAPERPWAAPAADVVAALATSVAGGLSDAEARARLARFGPNRLRETRRRSGWQILRDQVASPIVAMLAVAAALAFGFDERIEGAAIVAVIAINAAIGWTVERRALRSMDALRELGQTATTVRRGGHVHAVPAHELVPGDVIVLDAGDVLTADLRLVDASHLQADESALTGESAPVDKAVAPDPADAALGERASMLFKGTAVTRGAGAGVVVATGMETELGAISSLVEEAEPGVTPLEKRLDRLGRRLIGLTLAIAAVVAVLLAASGRDLFLAIETGIALAVAAIPEGLPIVATVALARGMWRMARRNALVEQLAAVETLGSTTIVLTDKTGTLTENRMTVVELALETGEVRVEGTGLETRGRFLDGDAPIDPGDAAEYPLLLDVLRAGALCNDAHLEHGEAGEAVGFGDPMEVALLVAAAKAGLERGALLAATPEVRELAFDPEVQRMATLHADGEEVLAAVKGAPEVLLDRCTCVRDAQGTRPLDTAARAAWSERAAAMAARGQRVLALATRRVPAADAFAYEQLELLGLVGFLDPPRTTVRAAIEACQEAGVRVAMVTGDHGATAWTVAAAVGLIDPGPDEPIAFVDARALPPLDELDEAGVRELLAAPVVARATPRQKLGLLELHQRRGAVVAMTGDGVNDAPALKQADIGIAMGVRGTQVAREAADMVLRDDELGTIVAAVEQGRAIFANIRKFVIYLLSCNTSEIFAVAMGALVSGPLPILPLQILFLNLVTDVFPALALGVGEGGPALMRRPPRDPSEPVLTRRHWHAIFGLGAVIALCVLAALLLATGWLELAPRQATTVAFLTLALAQLAHVFSMRDPRSGVLLNEITRNPWIWGALALCAGLLLLAVRWAPLAGVLGTGDPGPSGWGLALGLAAVPLVVGQVWLRSRGRRRGGADAHAVRGGS